MLRCSPFRMPGLLVMMGLASALWAQPPRTQFRTTVLMSNLKDPTQFAFLPDGTILVLSKNGVIQLHDPKTNATSPAGTLTVSNVREDGLHSIAVDPNFASNRRVYLLFGVTSPNQAMVVARFTVNASNQVDVSTRQNILTVPYSMTSTDEHNTGCLAFDLQGNLFVALADNTNNFFSGPTLGYSPRDPARPNYDAQRTAANSNDLRGKILRIHPEDNGTYTHPAGNLFAPGTANTKPEIYAMGLRHPFRITVDRQTGWLFWAEPGPNATADDANQGPRGYDEVNVAKSPGFYGWPYCVGNNFCYHSYNYSTNTGGAVYNPGALQNNSSNNTGIAALPAARPALVWYPYNATGTAFPIFGNGSVNTSMLGPVYNFDPAIVNANKIPLYYHRHLFIFDFSRSLVHAVQLDSLGAVVAVKRFWDQTTANPVTNPIDLKAGPDGAFYFLTWGDNGAYPTNAGHGSLVRLDYTGPADPVARPAMEPTRNFEIRLIVADGNRLRLPPGSVGVDIFDLHGARVWSHRQGSSFQPALVKLPAELKGALRVRIRFE